MFKKKYKNLLVDEISHLISELVRKPNKNHFDLEWDDFILPNLNKEYKNLNYKESIRIKDKVFALYQDDTTNLFFLTDQLDLRRKVEVVIDEDGEVNHDIDPMWIQYYNFIYLNKIILFENKDAKDYFLKCAKFFLNKKLWKYGNELYVEERMFVSKLAKKPDVDLDDLTLDDFVIKNFEKRHKYMDHVANVIVLDKTFSIYKNNVTSIFFISDKKVRSKHKYNIFSQDPLVKAEFDSEIAKIFKFVLENRTVFFKNEVCKEYFLKYTEHVQKEWRDFVKETKKHKIYIKELLNKDLDTVAWNNLIWPDYDLTDDNLNYLFSIQILDNTFHILKNEKENLYFVSDFILYNEDIHTFDSKWKLVTINQDFLDTFKIIFSHKNVLFSSKDIKNKFLETVKILDI